jgi:hypothetical protein
MPTAQHSFGAFNILRWQRLTHRPEISAKKIGESVDKRAGCAYNKD